MIEQVLVFLCDSFTPSSPGWSETRYVDQDSLELRDSLASAFTVLGLKTWANADSKE